MNKSLQCNKETGSIGTDCNDNDINYNMGVIDKLKNCINDAPILERNNFYQTQKSLWVYPYECKEEIAVICKNLNILPYVIVMTTEKLPNEEKMVAHFGLDN